MFKPYVRCPCPNARTTFQIQMVMSSKPNALNDFMVLQLFQAQWYSISDSEVPVVWKIHMILKYIKMPIPFLVFIKPTWLEHIPPIIWFAPATPRLLACSARLQAATTSGERSAPAHTPVGFPLHQPHWVPITLKSDSVTLNYTCKCIYIYIHIHKYTYVTYICIYTYLHIYIFTFIYIYIYMHSHLYIFTYTLPTQYLHNAYTIPYHTIPQIPYHTFRQAYIHTHIHINIIYIYILYLPFHLHMYIYIHTIMLTCLPVFRFLTPPLRLELAHGSPKLRHSRHDAVVADSTSQHCWEEHDLPPQKPGPQNKVNRVDGSEMVCVFYCVFRFKIGNMT